MSKCLYIGHYENARQKNLPCVADCLIIRNLLCQYIKQFAENQLSVLYIFNYIIKKRRSRKPNRVGKNLKIKYYG